MDISVAALSFLILAAALGPPAHAALQNRPPGPGVPQPGVCCLFYTKISVPCTFLKDYFETSRECSQPAVIFTSIKERKICAYPRGRKVRECMEDIDSHSKQGKRLAEEKLQ